MPARESHISLQISDAATKGSHDTVALNTRKALKAHLRDFRPRGLSKLLSDRSMPEAALRSPLVRAPKDCRRRATAAAKRFSPPRLVATNL